MDKSSQSNSENSHKEVVLKPYLSQVGGHNVFLRYDATTLCKPFDAHEYHFYKKLSPSLKNFIPEFRGLARVKRQVSQLNGGIYYVAIPIDDSALNSCDYLLQSIDETNSKIEELENNNMTQDEVNTAVEIIEKSIDYDCSTSLESKILHPWMVEARRKFDIKWIKYNYDTKVFMLLENITARFEYPSILDLKIGFRAHGDLTHESKRIRKENRINNSTSSICGIRLCGMQIFDHLTKKFHFKDKYHGRKIDLIKLKQILHDFFKIKNSYHIYFVVILILKVRRLINALKTQNSLRLFATSLLIVFENIEYSFEPVDTDKYCLKFPPDLHSDLEDKSFHLSKSDIPSLSHHSSLSTLFNDVKNFEFDNSNDIDNNLKKTTCSEIEEGISVNTVKSSNSEISKKENHNNIYRKVNNNTEVNNNKEIKNVSSDSQILTNALNEMKITSKPQILFENNDSCLNSDSVINKNIEPMTNNNMRFIKNDKSFDKTDVFANNSSSILDINKMLNDANFFEKYSKYVDVRLIDFAQASFIGTSDLKFINSTIKKGNMSRNSENGINNKHSFSDETLNKQKVTANFDHLCYMGPDSEFMTGLENICIFYESLLYELFSK